MNRFSGKIAIVTGGGTGIGAAVACQLSREGAEAVYIWGRRSAPLEALAESEPCCAPMVVDVGDEGAVQAAVEAIVARHGRVDFLVNMAAISGPSLPTEAYSLADFERVYRTNVFGTFLTMKYCLPHMQRNGFGAIVNACSCSGMRGYAYEIGYGSSKFAVLGLTQNAASENGRNGVRINCVSPGWVDTEMMDGVLQGYKDLSGKPKCKSELNHGTMDRPATPDEVSEVICFLLSDAACYINGATLVCDGGKTLC